jgi:hypothetical protein
MLRHMTRTYALTHSPVFARMLASSGVHSESFVCAKLQRELLHGVAAQDAFVALFDQFDDFDELAREATQSPIPFAAVEPQRRERHPHRRGARGASAHSAQDRARGANSRSRSQEPRTR